MIYYKPLEEISQIYNFGTLGDIEKLIRFWSH